MKLQKILSNFQKLHPKEIDLSLDRIKNLCEKLGNPQNKIKAISIVGTNGKNSTIQAAYSILKEANFKCNVYTSPHLCGELALPYGVSCVVSQAVKACSDLEFHRAILSSTSMHQLQQRLVHQ